MSPTYATSVWCGLSSTHRASDSAWANMPARQCSDSISPAQRLGARWNLFRSETNTLYDTLLWQPVPWPCLTLQWQPISWQPPQHIIDAQHAAAQAAQNTALGLDIDTAADDAADIMDIDETASPDTRNHINSDEGELDGVDMPMEYQYLISGEQTSGQEPSNIVVWRVSLLGQLPDTFDHDSSHLAIPRAEIAPIMVIPYGNEDVNHLHLQPSNTNLLAACSDSPLIQLYDLSLNPPPHHHDHWQRSRSRSRSSSGSKSPGIRTNSHNHSTDDQDAADHDAESPDQQPAELTAVLGGRSAGGFALQWNPVHPGLLLAADVAGVVQLWDVQRGSSSRRSSGGGSCRLGAPVIEPVQALSGFSDCGINDISWHSGGTTFAAATEQGQLLLQDIRTGPVAAAQGCGFSNNLRTANIHVSRLRAGEIEDRDCLSVDFDPNHSYRLASGGKDGYVYVLDMRKLDHHLERLPLHAGDVRQVSWSAGAPGLLASAGEDSHVLLWDANKMKNAAKQRQRQQSLGLPEPQPAQQDMWQAIKQLSVPGLLFLHHGHMAAVEQIAWNPDRPWMLASASGAACAADASGEQVEVQPSTLMVWEVNKSAGLLS